MKKPITLSIDDKLIKKLKKLAIDDDTRISSMVEEWINGL